jgi:hypothetical protein
MDKLVDLLRDLVDQKFWGCIEIKVQNGVIVHVNVSKSIPWKDSA